MPLVKPDRPNFSSGPCAKFLGWSPEVLANALVGRSHRAAESLDRIRLVLSKTRQVLKVPDDYWVAITPGSATGAFEMALWNLIGARGVDVVAWDVFGRVWVHDLIDRLALKDVNSYGATLGSLPDLSQVNCDRDVVFTWNGSTGGVCIPDADWIPENRQGLTFCDATSAAFAYDLPWDKLDVTAFSWQKALGGEAAHGMIILGPRAVERLKTYTPEWPVPFLLRMKFRDEIATGLFEGVTLNTPSMLCIEDFIQSLNWAERLGGIQALEKKSKMNRAVLEKWTASRDWIEIAAKDVRSSSHTTVCLRIIAPWFEALNFEAQWQVIDKICLSLRQQGAAFDINNHRHDQPSLRIWCGPTVEVDDLKKLTPWLDWAYEQVLL